MDSNQYFCFNVGSCFLFKYILLLILASLQFSPVFINSLIELLLCNYRFALLKSACIIKNTVCIAWTYQCLHPSLLLMLNLESESGRFYSENVRKNTIIHPSLCGMEDQISPNVYPCACHKRRLIMGYKLFYTTGLL